MVKLEAGKEKETIGRLTKFYESYNSGYSFDYSFLDQEYQAQYGQKREFLFWQNVLLG
ncbi:MAG: putative ABC transport system permease protein [Cyclobacteriaceae bacterium]|jgi:hypothetical protein